MPSFAPRKRSLVDEVVELLRPAIHSGRWQGSLPSERDLSLEMKVSRPTLRAAFAILEKENLLMRKGRHCRLISAQARPLSAPAKIVRLFSPLQVFEMQEHELIWLDEFRSLLAAEGYELHFQVKPGLFVNRGNLELNALLGDTSSACRVVYRSNLRLQKWFAQHAPNTVLVGSAYEDVALSSVDMDQRAICRHAAGMLLRAGHTRIVWVGSQAPHAGDLRSEAGFSEAFAVAPDQRLAYLRHDGTAAGVCRVLDVAFSRQAPPTGLVVANSNHTLTVICHLATRGLIAGVHYALIARDGAPFFDSVRPSLAHYAHPHQRIAKTLAKLVLTQAQAFSGNIVHKRIMADFVPGASLAAASALKRPV